MSIFSSPVPIQKRSRDDVDESCSSATKRVKVLTDHAGLAPPSPAPSFQAQYHDDDMQMETDDATMEDGDGMARSLGVTGDPSNPQHPWNPAPRMHHQHSTSSLSDSTTSSTTSAPSTPSEYPDQYCSFSTPNSSNPYSHPANSNPVSYPSHSNPTSFTDMSGTMQSFTDGNGVTQTFFTPTPTPTSILPLSVYPTTPSPNYATRHGYGGGNKSACGTIGIQQPGGNEITCDGNRVRHLEMPVYGWDCPRQVVGFGPGSHLV